MNITGIIESVKTELMKYDNLDSIELEARLGIYDIDSSKFSSNIGSANYEKINEMLDTFKGWNNKKNEVSTVYSKDNMRLKVSDSGDKSVIEKVKLKNLTYVLKDLPLDIRISISRETPIPTNKFPRSFKTLPKRIKERISREFQNASFDLTSVKVPVDKIMEQTFEFEVEHIGDFKNPEEAIFQIIYKVLDANYMLDGFQRNEGMTLPLELFEAIKV